MVKIQTIMDRLNVPLAVDNHTWKKQTMCEQQKYEITINGMYEGVYLPNTLKKIGETFNT